MNLGEHSAKKKITLRSLFDPPAFHTTVGRQIQPDLFARLPADRGLTAPRTRICVPEGLVMTPGAIRRAGKRHFGDPDHESRPQKRVAAIATQLSDSQIMI